MVKSLWRTLCKFSKKLNIGLPYDHEITLLGIYSEKNIIQKDAYTPMFIEGQFTIAKKWKQPKCPLTEMNKEVVYTYNVTLLFSCSVMYDSLRSHEWQHTRFPCPYHVLELVQTMSIELVMPSSHFIIFHLLHFLPSNFPNIRVFSDELSLHIRWPKYWSFRFSISPSNEYSVLISFRIGGLIFLQSKKLSGTFP